MLVVFNKAALLYGGGSVLASLGAAYSLGWIDPHGTHLTGNEKYAPMLCGILLVVSDLARRLRHLPDIKVPPPPTIFTRDGPVPTRPQPVLKTLNMFLSGEKGAQFFWVLPGWILGLLLIFAAHAPRAK